MFASLAISLLMVSNVRYPSFKAIKLGKISFRQIVIALMLVLAILFAYPIFTIVTLITLYVAFGAVRAIYYLFIKRLGRG